MKKKIVVKRFKLHRALRNTGILFVLVGLFALAFTVGYFVFNNSSVDFLHLDLNEGLKHIILFWEPIIGGAVLVIGVILISRFEYVEEIDA